jgi:hypothetical protein
MPPSPREFARPPDLIDVSPKSGGGVAAGRRARSAEALFAIDAAGLKEHSVKGVFYQWNTLR